MELRTYAYPSTVLSGVENLWINTARYDITAVTAIQRDAVCVTKNLGVSSQVGRAGRKPGFQTHFPDVMPGEDTPPANAGRIVR